MVPTNTTTLLCALLVLLGLAGCGDLGPAKRAPRGEATVSIATTPPSEIWVDGTSRGFAPVELTLPAGSHALRAHLGGFEDHVATLELAAGANEPLALTLVAADAEDREVLQLLADAHDLWIEPLEPVGPHRGDDAKQPLAVYPRGDVRPGDLREYRIDFPAGAATEGVVRFLKGDKPFFEQKVASPETGALVRSLPEDVATNLAAGDKVTWGFYPAEGAATTASFDVVDKDVDAVIAAVKKGLKSQPQAAVTHIIAQVYTDAGLHYAAHQFAARAIEAGQTGLRPWAVILDSLGKMGAPKGAFAIQQAQKQIAAFSALQAREVYFRPNYPIERMLQHMDQGEAGRVLLSLGKADRATLTESPAQAQALAFGAATRSRYMALRSPIATRKVAAALVELTKEATAQAPEDATAQVAHGYARLHEARVARALDAKPDPAAYLAAADALLAAYDLGLDDGGRVYLGIVDLLREALTMKGADEDALLARCAEVAEQAVKRFPKEPLAGGAQASAQLAKASVAPTRRTAREALEAAFETLGPQLQGDGTDPVLFDLHAEAVTADRARKAGLKYPYIRAEHGTPEFLLRFAVPRGGRWLVYEQPPEGTIARIEERGLDGDLRRVVTIRTAAAGVEYVFPTGERCDGDNVRKLAEFDLDATTRAYRTTKGRPRVQKKRFSRALRSGYGFEATGTDAQGAWRRTTAWYAKSEHHPLTFLITDILLVEPDKQEPAFELFVDSLVEVEPAGR